ncbi:MAG: hypothetical protein R6V10_07790 [bacterium]
MLEEVLENVLGFRRPRFPLATKPLPVTTFEMPSILSFALISCDGRPFQAEVKEGDEVEAGQALGSEAGRAAVICPVKGKVTAIVRGADLRGASLARTVLINPAADTSPVAFNNLDPDKDSAEELWKRMEEAGVLTDSLCPRPLSQVIGPESGIEIDTLVVLAADREPEVSSTLALFRERKGDISTAARMLGRMCGANKVTVAVPAPLVSDARSTLSGTEVVSIPASYPETLEPLVIQRVNGTRSTRVIALETALAALDAVREGKVPSHKMVSLISPAGKGKSNLRVPLGTRLRDLFQEAGLSPRDRDKVIVGGPLRGFAQYSLDASVDQGVDAFMLIPSEEIETWTNEPCVNCGACLKVCPVKLQPGLLGKFGEFGLFDRAEEFSVDKCIECGLCAAVCTGRRPILQWIRMAKNELAKKRASQEVAETEKCETEES